MKIGVISDTHARSFDELPRALIKALGGCDLILHAGDIISLNVIRGLEGLAPVVAVHGNMDQAEVWSALPEKKVFEAAGRKIGLIHGSGGPDETVWRVKDQFVGVDIIVFGHTHEPLTRTIGGVIMFNPGRASHSYGVIELGDETKCSIRQDYY